MKTIFLKGTIVLIALLASMAFMGCEQPVSNDDTSETIYTLSSGTYTANTQYTTQDGKIARFDMFITLNSNGTHTTTQTYFENGISTGTDIFSGSWSVTGNTITMVMVYSINNNSNTWTGKITSSTEFTLYSGDDSYNFRKS